METVAVNPPYPPTLPCMDLELGGRVVLVVGGTGLIGRKVVERLRTEGATVVPASRRAEDGVTMDASDAVCDPGARRGS